MNWRKTLSTAIITVAGTIFGHDASAAVIYLDSPTNLASPPNISFHNASGPVIADDFIPAQTGDLNELIITFWGSQPTSNIFELVMQNSNLVLGQPALTPPGNIDTGGIKTFAFSSATPTAIPGIFQFTMTRPFAGPAFTLAAGQDYWLTIANTEPGWNWAEALGGPTVGAELFNAQRSTGPLCLDGGPHCGPWTDLHTDFAFQIDTIPTPTPEPASLVLLGSSLIGFAAIRRRRRV